MWRRLVTPRLIAFHVVVVAGVVLMVNLGLWQLDRLEARRDFNETVVARADAPALPVEQVLDALGDDPADLEWVPAEASGTWLPDEQVVVVNRSQGGVAGYDVVTPVRLSDGRILIVDRGFSPLTADVPTAPNGPAVVAGLLRKSQDPGAIGARDPATGELREIQRVDVERLAAQLPGPVVPVWLSLEAPVQDGLTPLPRPALSEGPHLAYAVQWFIFAVCVVIGWGLAVRRTLKSPAPATPSA
jgi:surfeit locus 1 family protein